MKEFEKWWKENGCNVWDIRGCEVAWRAALKMIKYEGVISDYELASKIIKEELGDGDT